MQETDTVGASSRRSFRGRGQGPAGPTAWACQGFSRRAAFVLDESAQLLLKAQPHSSGLSGPEGIQLSPQVTSGVGGHSTLSTGLHHLQRVILSQHGTMGFFFFFNLALHLRLQVVVETQSGRHSITVFGIWRN